LFRSTTAVDPAPAALPAVTSGVMVLAAWVASPVAAGVVAIELATTGTTRSLGVPPGALTGVVTVTVGEVGGTVTPPGGGVPVGVVRVTVGVVTVTVGVVTGEGTGRGRRGVTDGSATVNPGTVTVKVGPVTVKLGVVTVADVVVSAGFVPVAVVLVGEVELPSVDTVSVSAVVAAPIAPPANADPAHTPSTRREINEAGARAPRMPMTRTFADIDLC
jgi:hypothetical protein